MPEQKRRPVLLAMIPCDQVVRDERTRKVTIVGSFSTIYADEFPAAHRSSALYVALTGGKGDYAGALRFTLEETGEELMSAEGPFRLDNPLQVAELQFDIPALPLPKPGKYRMEFLCDGEPLMGRTFIAQEIRKGDGQ